jgi:integrase
MSISRTDQGTYRARIRDRYGKQLSKTFKLKADARAWEIKQLQERDNGTYVAQHHDSVAHWADQWLDASRDLAPSTVAMYRKDLRLHVLPHIGSYRLVDLTTEDIDQVLTHNIELGLAPATVHKQYRTIRRMLAVAVERKKVAYNVADAVKPPRIPHREMHFLDGPGLEQLADSIGERYRSWVLVAGWGGLRWSEIVGLRPSDITGDVIDVRSQLLHENGKWVRSPLKSKASKRRVPLPPSVAEELRFHMETYPADLVFTNREGAPINHASFTGNIFKPALVRARLDRRIRIHDLRHTAVALAIQAGAHPKTIQVRLGHASISVTLDTYGHLMPDMDSSLADDLDRLRLGNPDY